MTRPKTQTIDGINARENIYDYIEQYILQHKYSPSLEEIRKNIGVCSKNTVYVHLRRMREEGMIDFVDGIPRTITLPDYTLVRKRTES